MAKLKIFEPKKATEEKPVLMCANCGVNPRLPIIRNLNGQIQESDLCLECNQKSAWHKRMAGYRKAMGK